MSTDKITKIFMDSEFTGLNQESKLISLALVVNKSCYFYAEFTDYADTNSNIILQNIKDSFIQNNVIKNLLLTNIQSQQINLNVDSIVAMKGNSQTIFNSLQIWLSKFNNIEIWSDCLAYDWVLFCELFGGSMYLPRNLNYIPFDICTIFKLKNIDPDINREEFINTKINRTEDIIKNIQMIISNKVKNTNIKINKHNALFDAFVIKECYTKLMRLK